MPHFEVRIPEEQLDGKAEGRLIRSLTDALVRVYGERARSMAVVELFGIPADRWGHGGVQGAPPAPLVSLTVREAALHLPGVDNAPGRLVASITDAVTDACGPSVRDHVTVCIRGVPPGRSGVGGEVDPPAPGADRAHRRRLAGGRVPGDRSLKRTAFGGPRA